MRVRFPSSPSTGRRPLSRWLVAVGLLAVAVAGPVSGGLPHAAAAPLPERVSWTAEVNDGKVTTDEYFVLRNLCTRIDGLVAAKGT